MVRGRERRNVTAGKNGCPFDCSRGGSERRSSLSSSLAQLARLDPALASCVKNGVYLCRERFSSFLELVHLVFDGFRGVALVQLQAIRTGRLALAEAFQVRYLFVDASQLGLKSRELFAICGAHLRTSRLRGRVFPWPTIPFIAHLRNRASTDISQVVIGPDFLRFLGLLM